MLKHICVMLDKGYGGSYGIGDTPESAKKRARAELGKKPVRTEYRTAEVPDGHHLKIRTLPSGIEWYLVPDEQPTAAT